MATKLQKMAKHLNDSFGSILDQSFAEKFDIEVQTRFSIFSRRLHTSRADGESLTREQYQWIEAFSKGYESAMNQVSDEQV